MGLRGLNKNQLFKAASAFVLALALLFAPLNSAQAQGSDSGGSSGGASKYAGPRRQITLIIYAGLGGAVLGLSTLSFYGRPQDNLSNVAIGFAFGVIAGTVFTAYTAATNPRDFYGEAEVPDRRLVTALAPQLRPQIESAAADASASRYAFDPAPLKGSWSWSF